MPELRKASSRRRCESVSKFISVTEKISRVGLERDARAALRGLLALLDRRDRQAALVALAPDVAVAMDLELEPLGEEVDDRDADAVQAAGDFVRVVVELSAGVQLGHDDLGRRAALFLVDVDGDAAAVVLDRHRVVDVDRDLDRVGVAGQRLVDGVVDDFVDHVVQAADVIGVADVHARALAHRIESLEDFDVFGCVRRFGRRSGVGCFVVWSSAIESLSTGRCCESRGRRHGGRNREFSYREWER